MDVNKTSNITAIIQNNKGKAVKGSTVKFYINHKLIGQTVTGKYGVANINYTPKKAGTYNLYVVSSGNSTVSVANKTSSLKVVSNNTKHNSKVTIKTNNKMTVGNKTLITANVINEQGQAVKNSLVTFKLGNKTIGQVKTGTHGIAYMYYTPTKNGTFTLTAIASGNKTTSSSNSSVQVNITKKQPQVIKHNSTVTINTNKKMNVGNKTLIKVTIRNEQYKAVKNSLVTFKLGNVTIGQVKTGIHGIANLYYTPTKNGTFTLTILSNGNSTTNPSNHSMKIIVTQKHSKIAMAKV